MTAALTLAMILVSAIGIAHLTLLDPKRIRAHGLATPEAKRHPLAWIIIWLPGLMLLVFDQWSAALMWLGGVPIVGWLIVATPPQTLTKLEEVLCRCLAKANHIVARSKQMPNKLLRIRITAVNQDDLEMNARIDKLESRLEKLEQVLLKEPILRPERLVSSGPCAVAAEAAEKLENDVLTQGSQRNEAWKSETARKET